MPNPNWGGPRQGAGRRPVTEFDLSQDTPLSWLWQELAQRFGSEASQEIHLLYNEKFRAYQKSKQAEGRQRRAEIEQKMLGQGH